MAYEVTSIIDRSESYNPVLRVSVGMRIKGRDNLIDERSYNMSLRRMPEDNQEWCKEVITRHFEDVVLQVERGTKKEIKNMIADTFAWVGLDITK